MQFSDIIGHNKITSELKQLLRDEKVPQGIMFLEQGAYGALPMALATALSLLCQKPVDGLACMNCQSCKMASQNTHPDLHFAFPVVKHSSYKRSDTFSDHFIDEWRTFLSNNAGYAEPNAWISYSSTTSGNANINVKECNEIIKKLSLRAYGGKAKVLVFWLPEYLQKEGNRLLKIIEEPPADSYLFFVTQNPNQILPTILSRFQLFRLAPLTEDQISNYLINTKEIDSAKAAKIALASSGSLAQALDQLSDDQVMDSSLFLDWLRLSYESNPEKVFEFVNQFSKSAKSFQKQFFQYVLGMLQANLKYLFTGSFHHLNLPDEEIKHLERLAKILDITKISDITKIIEAALRNMDQNINVRIMMLADSFEIGRILRIKSA